MKLEVSLQGEMWVQQGHQVMVLPSFDAVLIPELSLILF